MSKGHSFSYIFTYYHTIKQQKKVLLILDGHTTHLKKFAAVKMTRDNGVIMLQLPGSATQCCFKPLETYYNQAVERWMRVHPGLAVTQFQVAELLGEVYGKAASISNSGFRKYEIWPVNRYVFSDVDFAVFDALRNKENLDPIDAQVDNENVDKDSSTEESSDDFDDNVPLAMICNKKSSSSKLNVSIEKILPSPKISKVHNVEEAEPPKKRKL